MENVNQEHDPYGKNQGNVKGENAEIGKNGEIGKNEKQNVAVYLLTGFLGSGKTTLLRRLIGDAEARGLKPAVLMNEVGDVNLDGIAVDAQVPMAELLGGCICCTIKTDVGHELAQLIKQYRPDVVFIESTGVAQPLEILDAVSEASLYARTELRGVVTVVDARHLLDRVRIGTGKTLRLMQDQIRVSSLLLLNKTDLVGQAELAELTEWLRAWNPHAELQQTIRCEADWASLWNGLPQHGVYTEDDDPHSQRLQSAPEAEHAGHQDHPNQQIHQDNHNHQTHQTQQHHQQHHQHHPHHDHDHVHVMTRYLHGAINSERFEQFLRELPDGVYRAKGIVTFNDTASRFLFQYAYRESDFMRITPQKTVHDVAVFIGENFSQTELEAKLDALFTSEE